VLLCLALPWPSLAETVSAPQQASVPADDEAEGVRGDSMAFDIPPQPLLSALRAYSEVTGQAVLVDDTLAVGRTSPGVRGNYDRTDALRRLLAGTGLVAIYSSDQAFTLKLAAPDRAVGNGMHERAEGLGARGNEIVIEQYAAKIQGPIEAALCQFDDTRPGDYRLALQMWIDDAGRVQRTRLLTPMTQSRRKADVLRALAALTLDPPPSGMPQPITLLLLPGRDAACADASPFVH
jgi:hypothetical protein